MTPTPDDFNQDDRPRTEADRTSQTRFGPRPVPPGHHVSQSRRVIPSGRVSPDGRPSHPTPSTGAKIALWGGVALGVAGGTAAAIFAIRKIAEAISDDEGPRPSHHARPRRNHAAPRFARMDEEEREAMRRRVRDQDREDRQEVARLRAEAARRRPAPAAPRRKKENFAEGLIETSTRLSQGLEGVAKSVALAVESFRGVAGQATGIVQEFAAAADQLRSALRGDNPSEPHRPHDDDRTHRL
ncbi:hypothetical protein [Paracoccus sp. S3-43]|uniref:hypothetical protein n=1 Tax=Paracoccus sp. S3-43 TaxID=3030011 RepID=UPI0023B1B0C4|nr:hypothetical protein [Paracoccus sp. S3-43]WEF22900.1 hypothetical protein PXD02_08545 [Paracoccus sp. S3-43]